MEVHMLPTFCPLYFPLFSWQQVPSVNPGQKDFLSWLKWSQIRMLILEFCSRLGIFKFCFVNTSDRQRSGISSPYAIIFLITKTSFYDNTQKVFLLFFRIIFLFDISQFFKCRYAWAILIQ